MRKTVERNNYIAVSAVIGLDDCDMAEELEAKVADTILKDGQEQYDYFSSGVTLKEVDTENETAEYIAEIRFTDYGTFYEGSPSSDYYDPPDSGDLIMDDVHG